MRPKSVFHLWASTALPPLLSVLWWEEGVGDESVLGLPSPSLGREAQGCRETFQMLVLAAAKQKTPLSAGCGLGAHFQVRSGWRGESGWRLGCHVCTRCDLSPGSLERVGFCVQSQGGGCGDIVLSKSPPSLPNKNN